MEIEANYRGKSIFKRLGPVDGLIHIKQIMYYVSTEKELNNYWLTVERSFLKEIDKTPIES